MKEGEGMVEDKALCPLCTQPLVAFPSHSLHVYYVECTKCDFKEKRDVVDQRLKPRRGE